MSAVTDRLTPDDITAIARIILHVRQRQAAEAAEREQSCQDGEVGDRDEV